MPRLRRWFWLATALGVALAFALAALPEVLRRVAASQIRSATGREVVIGDVDLNVFTGTLAVKTFRLADRDRPEPFVQFERLDARLRFLPLLTGHVRFAEVSLHGPTVRVVRTGPAVFNFSDLAEPLGTPKTPRRGGIDFTVDRFRLFGGTVVADDRMITPARTWKAEELSIEARDLSTRAGGNGGTATAALKLGDTAISMKADSVHLAPAGGRVALTIQGFDLSLLLPYLPPEAPASITSGRFSATLTLDYGSAGTRVGGEARLEQLVVLRRGQPTPFASLPVLTVAIKDADFASGGVTAKRIELAGDVSVRDESVSPPTRLDLKAVQVVLERGSWPARGPVSVQVRASLPGGGSLDLRGTAGLAPVAADLRVVLGGVDLAAFQPYLPIAGRIAGRADADLAVVASADRELTATVRGKAGVSRLSAGPGDRPVVEVERASATGIDIAWPSRVAIARVVVRKLIALIERDERGELPLRSLWAPRSTIGGGSRGDGTPVPARAPSPRKIAIEIGEVVVEDGYARFVDRTGKPPYSEELSRLAVTVNGLSNAPGKRAQLVAHGVVGGRSALALRGEVAPLGETLFIDLDGELREFTIPRANPLMERLLAWIARDGWVTTKVHYRVEGDRLEATNDVVIGRLEVTPAGEQDEVKRRLGLPLGLIVALMKDARGEIRVSVPVSGRLGAPEFSVREAIWTALRNVVVNILAAPFRLIGRLFTKGERIEALTIDPIRFESGSAAVSPAMGEHLQRVGEFLRASPFVRLTLAPVVTDADLTSLKTQEVTARIQRLQRERGITEFPAAAARVFREQFPDRAVPKTVEAIVAMLREHAPEPNAAARALAARRVEATREALVSIGGIPAERLPASEAPALLGAPGDGRVEVSITQ